jgi:hypothetical protein
VALWSPASRTTSPSATVSDLAGSRGAIATPISFSARRAWARSPRSLFWKVGASQIPSGAFATRSSYPGERLTRLWQQLGKRRLGPTKGHVVSVTYERPQGFELADRHS